MERTILHVDCNKFYASVECLHHPEIRNKPVAVCGDVELRHGIILTKNEIASKYNIGVGEPLWMAKQKCPDLIAVKPNFPLYMRFSRLVREILTDYSDLIEPFGLDESWVDVTNSTSLFGDAKNIAEEIRQRVKFELGITVSIGVSFNKIFAKLGSDYKKPDAITIFTKENFKEMVWPLKANEMLYVGNATYKKLLSHYRYTIGDIANTEPERLQRWFGKIGLVLHSLANGYDNSPVMKTDESAAIKSIGNSTTTPRDLVDYDDVKTVLYVLSESVCRRMRDQGFKCSLVRIHVRNSELFSFTRQHKLDFSTNITRQISDEAYKLFVENYNFIHPVRSIGVTVSEFCDASSSEQISLFRDNNKNEKLQNIDSTVDTLKRRYGNYCIQRANLLKKTDISEFNPYNDHVIHPVGFF